MAVAIMCAFSLGAFTGVASAQSGVDKSGYLTDTRGEVARSGFGLCWHTSSWTPARAIAECDPDLMRPTKAAGLSPSPLAALAPLPPPAPKPAAQRVKLDADTLFDFDKAVLRPAGRDALDDFVAKSHDIDPEVITAVGHADRFGSDRYNQDLSERRADSVRVYLLSKGIDSNRIKSEGRGETQPVTAADDCLGAKSAKVIACLQPDRRVDIEVVGTQIDK